MKVWVLRDHYEEVTIYDGDIDVTQIPYVATELGYLGEDSEERDEFIGDVFEAMVRGRGEASIEERFSVSLVEARMTAS